MKGQIVFENGLEDWPLLDQFISELNEEHTLTDRAKFGLRLVLSEAVANAIKHGNKSEHGKKVWLSWNLNYPFLELQIKDEGEGFQFEDISDPTQLHLLHKEGGRGVFLLKQYCLEVRYEYVNKTLVCKLSLD